MTALHVVCETRQFSKLGSSLDLWCEPPDQDWLCSSHKNSEQQENAADCKLYLPRGQQREGIWRLAESSVIFLLRAGRRVMALLEVPPNPNLVIMRRLFPDQMDPGEVSHQPATSPTYHHLSTGLLLSITHCWLPTARVALQLILTIYN